MLRNKNKAKRLEVLLNEKVKDVALAAEIKLAIQKNVLQRTKQGIFYFETNLGFTEEDVKEFLSEKDNQEIYLNIKSKIN